MRKLCLFIFYLCCLSSSFAVIEARNFVSIEQEKNYHSLTQELRCPQCQNNNIADSNATIAVDMRNKVFELLQQGNSKKQVIDYMVARYGHFITYDPPLTSTTIILWLAPIILLLLSLAILWKRHTTTTKIMNQDNTKHESLSEDQKQRLEQILNVSSREKQQ